MNQRSQFSFVFSLCPLCLGVLFLLVDARATIASLVVSLSDDAFEGELAATGADSELTFRLPAGPVEADSPGADETRSLDLDELVRWGRPPSPQSQPWVLLADGSLLVTAPDWSGGAAVRTDGEDVIVLTDAFDEVSLPRDAVRGVVFDQRSHPEDRERLVKLVRGADGKQDQVLLTNDDRVAGEIVELAKGSLTLAIGGADVKLPISRVRAAMFRNGASGRPREARLQQPGLRELAVGLRDGSMIYVRDIAGNADKLSLTLADGVRLDGATIDEVVFLQSLGSERFAYLSDLEPVDYRSVPYLNVEWPWERDRTVTGGPLTARGQRYLKGVGMHSAARLTYRLDAKYQRFDAAVAIDDTAGHGGSVTFGVYLLRDGKWQEAYQSDIVRGGDPPLPISVDANGAQGITLTVDYADRGDELDRADWLDARLIKN